MQRNQRLDCHFSVVASGLSHHYLRFVDLAHIALLFEFGNMLDNCTFDFLHVAGEQSTHASDGAHVQCS